jgi:hypothetical protein
VGYLPYEDAAKVIELLAVNRLIAPESELGVHQRWYATTAMDVVLGRVCKSSM